jgi:hypothetical protein
MNYTKMNVQTQAAQGEACTVKSAAAVICNCTSNLVFHQIIRKFNQNRRPVYGRRFFQL